MAVDVIMPRLGLTMDEGTVMRWLVAQGERVEKGQPILEVETDKVAMEVEAPAAGVMGPLLVAEGETVPVTALLARILIESELAGRDLLPPASPPAEALAQTTRQPTLPADSANAAGPTQAARPDRRFSSPRARTLARLQRLDWRRLSGSGPDGRIVERDVVAAIKARNDNRPAASPRQNS